MQIIDRFQNHFGLEPLEVTDCSISEIYVVKLSVTGSFGFIGKSFGFQNLIASNVESSHPERSDPYESVGLQ